MTSFRSGVPEMHISPARRKMFLALVCLSAGWALLILVVELLLLATQLDAKGSIAFVSSRSGNAEIYLLDIDQGRLHQVTHDPAADLRPSWSPDGQRLSFYSNRDGEWNIYVMQSSGLGIRQMTSKQGRSGNPSWSPDGRRIAFDSTVSGNLEIYIIDVLCLDSAPTCDPQRVTHHSGPDQFPSWSPDGQRLAFETIRMGLNERRTIFVIDAACVDQRCSGRESALLTDHLSDAWPAWSPDGRQIAFSAISDENWGIYVMDDGCEALPAGCAASVRFMIDPAMNAQQPAWSPDGRYLTFTAWGEDNMDLYMFDTRCAQDAACDQPIRRLTDHPGDDFAAAWWPE